MRGREPLPRPHRAPAFLAVLALLAGPARALQPLPGWPVRMKVSPSYAPCGVAFPDIDGDGEPEVAAGSTAGRLYLWEATGDPVDGWPVTIGGRIQSKPAVGDLDGDGADELVVLQGEDGSLWALDGDGAPLPGWPAATGRTAGVMAPVISSGPDGLTIISPYEDGIAAYSPAGVLLWRTRRPLGDLVAGPAVSQPFGLAAVLTEYAFLYLYGLHRGGEKEGFPFLAGQRSSWGPPVIADLEGDGGFEVLFTAYEMGQSVHLYCLESDGGLSPGFPVTLPCLLSYSSPVCADADADGDLEVFLCCSGSQGTVWALDHRGAVLPGWPVSPSVQMEGAPSVADMDGDGVCEVLAASGSAAGGLFCWDLQGRSLPELSEWGTGPTRTDCPAVADIDGDGYPELLLLTADGTLHAWATGLEGGRAPWPQLHRDAANTSAVEPLQGAFGPRGRR